MAPFSTIPKISIVTPSFNQAAYLEEALRSVKNQGYPNVEHIVVDGASTDGSVEVLRRHASRPGWEHLRWLSEPDRGQSEALNTGFRMATGDIVGWLNSDDRYRPKCFAHVVSTLTQMPATDVVYGDYVWIDVAGNCLQVRKEIEFSLFVLAYHRVLYIPSTATFFRRSVLEDDNLIDTQYQYAMDYEFFLRLALMGYRFCHIPQLLADFRWHSESKTGKTAAKQFEEHDQIAERYLPLLSKTPKGILRRVVRGGARILAAGRRYSEKALRGYYFQQFQSRANFESQIFTSHVPESWTGSEGDHL
jgi:glycosyltransferase involved in cell wall biosynthesis